MNSAQKLSLFFLRAAMGWMFFYAGITKVLNPEWTSAGYLAGAKTFTSFYQWLGASSMLPLVDLLNEWGLTLLGVSLMLGIFVHISAPLGALLMLLYYFPILDFPYPNAHSYIIDEHIIYALILLFLAMIQAGSVWGLDQRMTHLFSNR